jgi:hypothetical protein
MGLRADFIIIILKSLNFFKRMNFKYQVECMDFSPYMLDRAPKRF